MSDETKLYELETVSLLGSKKTLYIVKFAFSGEGGSESLYSS